MNTIEKINSVIFEKYNINFYGMYGEYPHKSFWSYNYSDADICDGLAHLGKQGGPTLLYVHIPFCPNQCFYCACSTVITRNYQMVKDYLKLLYREIEMVREVFERNSAQPNIMEIHFGGGSPSWLNENDFDELIEKLSTIVEFDKLLEFSLEVDPRGVDTKKLHYYHSRGVNRISFGVQDFNPEVQKAVNRVQPPELLERLLEPTTRSLFKGINFDIIYGLPKQSHETFRETIDKVVHFAPDRTCLLLLDYDPKIKKHQVMMDKSQFPSESERMTCFLEGIQKLTESGYDRIGLEHFAKPGDDLAKAFRERRVHWNTLGYTPGRYVNMIGLGSNSSSKIGDYSYWQNFYSVSEYEKYISKKQFPVYRGHRMTDDDAIRRDVIQRLRSYFKVETGEIESRYHLTFDRYFKAEIEALQPLIQDGLVYRNNGTLGITEDGTLLLALISNIFDYYKYDRSK